MHELFTQVLTTKDLSKAGELFSLDDNDIKNDLTSVLERICEIAKSNDYASSDNDQSVVEICITRVTSAIRFVYNALTIVKSLLLLLSMVTFKQTHYTFPLVLHGKQLIRMVGQVELPCPVCSCSHCLKGLPILLSYSDTFYLIDSFFVCYSKIMIKFTVLSCIHMY